MAQNNGTPVAFGQDLIRTGFVINASFQQADVFSSSSSSSSSSSK
jgi:hypothetical protein